MTKITNLFPSPAPWIMGNLFELKNYIINYYWYYQFTSQSCKFNIIISPVFLYDSVYIYMCLNKSYICVYVWICIRIQINHLSALKIDW